MGNDSFDYYHLTAGIACDVNSNIAVLINATRSDSGVLRREDVLDEENSSLLLNWTSFNRNESDNYNIMSLELFRLKQGSELKYCSFYNI